MARGWTDPSNTTPDDTSEVIVWPVSGFDCFAAQYVGTENLWFRANTNDVIATPIGWKKMPDIPGLE